jgi:hypothetical protein
MAFDAQAHNFIARSGDNPMKTILLAAAFAGLAFSAQAQDWAADVPLLDCDGIPCIDASLGSGPVARTMIDSGDILSIVDNTDAAFVGFGADNMKDGHIYKASHTTARSAAYGWKTSRPSPTG